MHAKRMIALLGGLLALGGAWGLEVGDHAGDVGTLIELDEQQYLQVFVEEARLALYTVDEERTIVENDIQQITLLVDNPGKPNDEWRALLKKGEDARITTPRFLPAPYRFRAQLIIQSASGTRTISNVDMDLDKVLE